MAVRSHDFHTTRWSLVLRAGSESKAVRSAALEELCARYWYPLYAFARRRGRAIVDAEDDVQAFLAHLLARRAFELADPERGRFRSFLLTAFKNHGADRLARERSQKRGGATRTIAFDFDEAEERYTHEPIDEMTPERLFSRTWAETLLHDVLGSLRASYEARGQVEVFDSLKGTLVGDAPSFAELACDLNSSEGSLRVAAHRLRGRYRDKLLEHISETLSDPLEAEAELADLFGALRPATGL